MSDTAELSRLLADIKRNCKQIERIVNEETGVDYSVRLLVNLTRAVELISLRALGVAPLDNDTPKPLD